GAVRFHGGENAARGRAAGVWHYAPLGAALRVHVSPFGNAISDLHTFVHDSRDVFHGNSPRHCAARGRFSRSCALGNRALSVLRGSALAQRVPLPETVGVSDYVLFSVFEGCALGARGVPSCLSSSAESLSSACTR